MIKKSGLSLIETLISLTIVGVSLIALLPVLTLRQETFSPVSGNNNFKKVESSTGSNTPEYYYTANQRVNLGELDTALALNNLTVNARGFRYQNTPALYLIDRLYFNTNKITKIDNNFSKGLHIASGDATSNTDELAVTTMTYPMNFYLDDTSVILNNGTIDSLFVPKKKNDDSWTINKSFIPWNNVVAGVSAYTTDLGRSRIQSISTQDSEYIHFSENNVINYDTYQFFYHIGIGKNALAGYNVDRNYTGIYNQTLATPLVKTGVDYNLNLAIGMLPSATNSWQEPESFVISHDATNSKFYFNANVVMQEGKSLSTNSVILASDRRLKTILGKYSRGLKEIIKINPVTFSYKDDKDNNTHVGVIAQSIRKIIPESISVNQTNGYLLVSTDGIFYALLNSIKELNSKNEELKKQNDELEQKIKELRKIAGGKHE